MTERYTRVGVGDPTPGNNQETHRRQRRLSVFHQVSMTLLTSLTTSINHYTSSEDRMKSFGSAALGTQRRSGPVVLTFLLALLLGAVTPPSLWSQVTSLTATPSSPTCYGTSFNLDATVTSRQTPSHNAPAGPGALGALVAQGAGANNSAVTNLALGNDQLSAAQNPVQFGGADFEFMFYGELLNLTDNGFYVSSNGFITFLNGVNTGIIPANVPNAAAPNKTIILANIDLEPDAGGNIWWQVQTDGAGNDLLVITFENVMFQGGAGPPGNGNDVDIQLIISEHNNAANPDRITWNLLNIPQPGGFYGVIAGFENECGNAGQAVYQNAAAAYAAIAGEQWTSDHVTTTTPYASVLVKFFDGATLMGSASPSPNPPLGASSNTIYAVPLSFRGVGTHSYWARAIYTYNNCTKDSVDLATPLSHVVVANPVSQTITNPTAPNCGNAVGTASVPVNTPPNTYTWSGSPAGAFASFTPNGTNAASTTNIVYNNAALSPSGTSVTLTVVEALSVAPFCATTNTGASYTVYPNPGSPTITGSGTNNGGINPPASPGASGNPCAGTSRTYTATASLTAPGATYYYWQLTGAAAGTTVNGFPVSGGAVNVVNTTNTVTIVWGNSTTNYTATLVCTASNGTGGVAGSPGTQRSCVGASSLSTPVYINGVPAVAPVLETVPGPAVASPTTVCENDTRTYGVPLTLGSTYAWSVTNTANVPVAPGAGTYTLVTGVPPNNNSATIDWNGQNTYRVHCTETTSGGCVTTHTFHQVLVNDEPQPVLSAPVPATQCTYIGGPIQNGQNLAQYPFTVTPHNATNRFDWAVTNGVFVSTGISSITNINAVGANATQYVRWTSPGTNQVTVTETIVATGCAKTVTQNVTVVASPTPKTITGPGYVTGVAGNPCDGTGPHAYSISGPVGANTYTWSIVSGPGSIVGPAIGTSVNINWTPAGGPATRVIKVVEQEPSGGCQTERHYTININPQPNGSISPNPTAVCDGSTVKLKFIPVAGTVIPGATYSWYTSTPGNISFVGSTTFDSVVVQGTNAGPALVAGNVTVDVTNPGVGGCTQTFTSTVNVVPNPTVLAPTVPSPICVGGAYTITANASAWPGAPVNRYWTLTLTPTAAYSGATVLTTTVMSNAASYGWNIVIGDSSVADILSGGTFDLTVTVNDSLAPAGCKTTANFPGNVVSPRPVRPQVDFPVPQVVCDGNYPQVYNITNFNAALTYSTGTVTPGILYVLAAPTITINDWGVPGPKVFELIATDATGCGRLQRYNINVVATPVNPQPQPITIANVCVDSFYFDKPMPVGPISPDPTHIVTYSAPSPLANHWYEWVVTNGFIITGTPGAYSSVGTSTVAALNATSCQVVWTGPTPGKVKYLVYTSDPNSAPPNPCFATSIEPTVGLPLLPNVPLTFTTTSSEPGDKVCEGNTIDLILSGSKLGLIYQVEEEVAGVWTPVAGTMVSGTGMPINITIPTAALTITTSPFTDHVFRITAKDTAFTPKTCEWLRTSVNNIVVHVYDTPNDIPVSIAAPTIICEGESLTFQIGTAGQPSQTHVMYEVWYRQIHPVVGPYTATVPLVTGLGNGGVLSLGYITPGSMGTGGALLNTDNYEFEVRAYIPAAPSLPPASGCPATMTAHPTARIFQHPVDPTVTFVPNPICWEEDITVNLASSEAGVEYEVRANGSFLSPQVILQGTGGPISATFNSTLIQPTNPVGSAVVPNVEVQARLVSNASYPRPIPTSACPVAYGTINYTVYEKPVAVVTGPATSCGPSTATYTASPVTPAPPMYFDWLITTVPPAGTTPTFLNNTGVSGTSNPFIVNWGTHTLNCDGTYNPLAQTIRMIATNMWGCTDTAFFNLTIEPTVSDALISGPSMSCIYGGFEEHLDTFTVERPAPCVFPAGTTYLWTMPTGVVSGAIRSGQYTTGIVAEWYTTGGTNIGTVQCDITLPPSHGGCVTTVTKNVVVYPLPVPVINGPVNVCQNDTNRVYTADNYPSDTYYWQVIGGTIDGGTGSGVVGDTATRYGVGLNTISVDWLDTPNPNAFIRLKQVSSVGCMNITTLAIVVNPTPVPVINGADVACDNSVYTYSTADNAPNNTYLWTVMAGGNATITGGANQATATVLTGDIGGGTSFTLQLTETVLATNCTKTVTKTVNIVEKPNPTIVRLAPAGGAVGGACLGQTITYGETDPVAGNPSYSYKWSVANGSITGSDENSTLVVTWNTVGSGTVTLSKWHTGSQCTTTVSQTVNIVNPPAPTISGPLTVCGESTHVYSTPNITGNTYSWTISGNGTITSGAATNAATILFDNPTPGSTLPATITVTETNTLSGCAATVNVGVTINYQPQVATVTRVSPAGPANQACNNSTIIYSVPNNTGSTYNWTVTGGTIIAGGTTNQVTVQWVNVGTQTLTVVETDISGTCSATTVHNVGVTYQPVPAITGDANTCTGDEVTYSTPDVPGSTYAWSLPSLGGTFTSGTTSHTVTVEWMLTGARTIQVVETNGNCTATATLTVNVGKTPTSTAIARITPAGNVAVACVNQTITYGTTNTGNDFLWTVSGGSIIGSNTSYQVTVEWTTVGSHTITLKETATGTDCSTTVTQVVNVEDQPVPNISGATPVCTGDIKTYSVTAVPGHTYAWSISGGGNIMSSATSSSVDVEWTTAGTWTVDIVQSNATGNCTATSSLTVVVNQTPVQTVITGAETVCNGSVQPYSVTAIGGQEYTWTVTGGTITTGVGTNAITVQWTAMGLQNVKVKIKTIGTNCEVILSKDVTVEFQPAPSITGDAVVCTNTEETYSTPANPGSTYLWTVTGGTITSATTSPTVTIKWTNAGSQTVTVTEWNASGNCQATATMTVTVHEKPSTTDISRIAPAGPLDHACENDTITYSTPFNASSSYVWTVTGGSFVGSSTGNSVVVHWTAMGNQTLTVVETTTGTDCQTTDVQNITVTYKPTPNINGANVACINKDHVYSTPYVAGSTYEWTITPSNVFAPITGYPNSNTIQVKWIQPGLHTVSVTETNVAGGCSTTATMQVQVNEIPTPFISSVTGYGNPAGRRPGIVCNFSTHTYTTFPTPGNTFIWTVTGGTIVSGQYTNTVDVKWGPAGEGTLAVQETVPGSDCIVTDKDTFDIRPTPTPSITGNFNPCGNSTQTYTTPFVSGNSYNWVVVGGIINSGQGTNTITVTWMNPAWPNVINGSVEVTEWVTDVLPSMSCIATNTRMITVRPNPPVPTITGLNVVCATDLTNNPATDNMTSYSTSIPATGSNQGSVFYTWSVSSNGTIVGSANTTSVNVRWTNNTSVPQIGTVTITQTSSFGCVTSASLNVTINPLPEPSISGPVSVCLNNLLSYTTPGVPGNTYNWFVSGGNAIRSGQGTPNVMVEWTMTGTHTLSVVETNSYGCSVQNNLQVVVHELPSVEITASGPTTFCQGGDVTLSAPIGFVTYVWSTGETGRSIVVHTGGSYYVTVTDENGCTGVSNTITVNVFPSSLPIITVSGPTTFCEGNEVTLTAPSGFTSYYWSTGATTQSIVVTQSGTYTVTVADNNGCTGTSTEVDVFVNPKPAPVLTVVGSTTVCSGDSVEVRAPNGYVSYSWTSSSNTNYGTGRSITVRQTDTLYCTVVDANGCTGVSDTVIITVAPVVAPVITPNGPTTFCEGGAVVLSAPAGFSTYFWSNGATTREITVQDGGTYSVTVTSAAMCESSSLPTDVTVNPLPARPTITRHGDVLTANSSVAQTYQWYHDGTMVPGATQQTLAVSQSGVYRVEITDDNSCGAISDGFNVALTDVAEGDVTAGRLPVHIFPNPTNGQFTIEADLYEVGPVHIELVNTIGEVVFSADELYTGGTFKTNVNMGTLANGMYNVVITSGSERWTVRLVRQ